MTNECQVLGDPIWTMFQEWLALQKQEVTTQTSEEMIAWLAFKAGAEAEHKRIVTVFADAGVMLSAPPSDNGEK